MFFTFQELFDIVFMTVVGGLIFERLFKPAFQSTVDLTRRYDKHEFLKWSMLLAGSAIVLHELGHKFSALFLGMEATLHAPYGFLLFALFLVLIGSPFIFFVGGYVSYHCNQLKPSAYCVATQTITPYFVPSALAITVIAFSGPAINLLIWFVLTYLLNQPSFMKKQSKKKLLLYHMMKQINIFLFFFNMLPIPGFDGFHFFTNLFKLL